MSRAHDLLIDLRRQFPQPVSDPVHDAYFVYSIAKALEQVDNLKSQVPMLGQPVEPDYDLAQSMRIPQASRSLEAVLPELVQYLQGMFIWGHPRSQINIVPNPSIASIIGVLLPSTYNPNLCSDESGRRISEAEVAVASMTAELVGYRANLATGVFTFGGTGGLLYAMKVGLEKALPGACQEGVRPGVRVFASDCSHYACLNAASWLGIGQNQVVKIATGDDNSMDLPSLATALRQALSAGQRVACIMATLGTTDAFGLDDLRGIVQLRDSLVREFELDYVPHIHADAVIGWAWSVFNDYDYTRNELEFRGRTLRALAAAQYRLRHLGMADSIGIDFHKSGFVPYISAMVLFKERSDLQRIARARETMPYLYQSGHHHPGMFTLETTRSGTGPLAALANYLLLGKDGYRTLLGHAVEMAEVLREELEAHPDLTVLNTKNVGPVTLFRVYPSGVDTFSIKQLEQQNASYKETLQKHNDYNRRVFQRVHQEALAGRGVVISLTDCYRETDYGEPIVALKSYVMSPFAEEAHMQAIVEHVLAARDAMEKGA